MSLSLAKVSIAFGTNWKIDKVGKVSLTKSECTLNDSEDSFRINVNKVVGGRLTTLSNQIDEVSLSQDVVTTMLTHRVVSLQNEATAINNKFNTMSNIGATISFTAATIDHTAGTFKISSALIKLG